MRFEQFEQRQMMAVTTVLNNGTLTITGDAANDDIAIVGTARPGELTITGRNGTVVNGLANAAATIGGVTGSLAINSTGGNDVVSLDNVFIARSIFIATGDGDDRVTLGARGEVSPGGELNIDTGAGNDQVYELNYAVFVVGANLINLGTGFDGASVIGASATGGHYGTAFPLSNTEPSIEIRGLDGQDNMLAVGLTARIEISLIGLGGSSIALLNSSADAIDVFNSGGTTFLDTNYSVTQTSIHSSGIAGGPDSSVIVNRCLVGGLRITLGPTNSFLRAYGNLITGSYPSRAGEPGTVLSGLYVYAALDPISGRIYLNRRNIELTYNVSPRAAIFLGDGDDSLTLIGNQITDTTQLYTGGGVNDVFQLGNTFGSLVLQNLP